jgi:hypothetical protein
MLDLRPEDVPHFWDEGRAGDDVARRVNDFLEPYGLFVLTIGMTGTVQEALDKLGAISNGTHYILVGSSANGTNHAVVCCGNRIVHDPSLNETGIVGPLVGEDLFTADFFCKRM